MEKSEKINGQLQIHQCSQTDEKGGTGQQLDFGYCIDVLFGGKKVFWGGGEHVCDSHTLRVYKGGVGTGTLRAMGLRGFFG